MSAWVVLDYDVLKRFQILFSVIIIIHTYVTNTRNTLEKLQDVYWGGVKACSINSFVWVLSEKYLIKKKLYHQVLWRMKISESVDTHVHIKIVVLLVFTDKSISNARRCKEKCFKCVTKYRSVLLYVNFIHNTVQ